MRGRRRPIKNKSYTKENIFDFSQILRILKIIWKSSKGLTIARFSLLILQAVLPLIPLYLMKLLLDSFANPEIKPEFNYVLLILSGFAATKILSIIISNIQVYVNL